MKKLLALGLAATLAAPLHAGSVLDQFDSFYVLGDSLSDNENTSNLLTLLGAAPEVVAPRVYGVSSDGQTWVKDFTDGYGGTVANLAFRSARATENGDPIPDLDTQITGVWPNQPGPVPLYTDGLGSLQTRLGDGSDKELVTVFIGGNDFLDAAGDTATSIFTELALRAAGQDIAADLTRDLLDDALDTLVSTTLNSVTSAISLIGSYGVDDFLVMNLPDFSVIPAFDGDLRIVGARLAAAAQDYNDQLATKIAELRASGLTITEVDFFALLTDSDAFAAAGITNVTTSCLGDEQLDCTGYLFFDDIHPARQGHEALAAASLAALEETYAPAVPLPAPALMLISALGGTMLLRRRKRAA